MSLGSALSFCIRGMGWLAEPQGFFKQGLNAPPAPLQDGRAPSQVHPCYTLRRAISAGTLHWVTHLRVGVHRKCEVEGAPRLCRALGSPALLVPSPRETPTVHCASPFFLFQGPRGPDGPAGEQGSKGLKVPTPVAFPSSHLPCWVRNPGTPAHSLLSDRPLWDSRASQRGCRAHS